MKKDIFNTFSLLEITNPHCNNPYIFTKENIIKEFHMNFISLCLNLFFYLVMMKVMDHLFSKCTCMHHFE